MPLVSIIVTTFNRKNKLKATINSILNQTYTNYELLIVDNYSDYDFNELIKSYNNKKIRAFQNLNHGIIAKNRNLGIKKSKGKYLAFCDDDDKWISNKLQSQIDYIETNDLMKKNFVIYSHCIEYNDNFSRCSQFKQINSVNHFIYNKHAKLHLSTTILNKSDPPYMFNESQDFIAVEDFLYWCQLLLNKYKFYLIDEPLVEYYVDKNSESSALYEFIHLKQISAVIHLLLKKNGYLINHYKLFPLTCRELIKFYIKSLLKKYNFKK